MPQSAPSTGSASPEGFELVNLSRDQVATLVQWAAAEGWDPGVMDSEIFYDTYPDSFVGYLSGGELIAGGSVVSYNGEYGFMGFFIVRPDLRHAGLGRSLWCKRRDVLLQRLLPGAAIGMDGVVTMQDFYRRGGFEVAYRDVRYARVGAAYPRSPDVAVYADTDFEAIAAFDRQCFGTDRRAFLKRWLVNDHACTFVYRSRSGVAGFATVRRTGVGAKIGPLFAEDATVASALYQACLTEFEQHSVALDIPLANAAAVALAEEHDAHPVFECARMYYGRPPVHRIDRVYGITTFELG